MFLAARPYVNEKLGGMAYGTSQFLGILSSLAFVIAADAYRHRPLLRREYGLVLLPVAIWFTLAPVALGAVCRVRAGTRADCRRACAAAVRRTCCCSAKSRLLGAASSASTLLTLAGVNVWLAAVVGAPGRARSGAPAFCTAGGRVPGHRARHAADDVRGHDLRAAHGPTAG